jgi:hypothetical protein
LEQRRKDESNKLSNQPVSSRLIDYAYILDLKRIIGTSVRCKFNNKELFVTATKNARNYYTHFRENLKKKVLRDQEFSWLTKDAELLLRLCILSELRYEITTLNEAFYTEG